MEGNPEILKIPKTLKKVEKAFKKENRRSGRVDKQTDRVLKGASKSIDSRLDSVSPTQNRSKEVLEKLVELRKELGLSTEKKKE